MNTQTFVISSREIGDTAAISCAAKARRVSGFDTEGAANFIAGLLSGGNPLPGEALVDAAKHAGFKPHDDRAFGSVFATLSKRRVIRCAGYCERTKGHGTAGGRLWERAPSAIL